MTKIHGGFSGEVKTIHIHFGPVFRHYMCICIVAHTNHPLKWHSSSINWWSERKKRRSSNRRKQLNQIDKSECRILFSMFVMAEIFLVFFFCVIPFLCLFRLGFCGLDWIFAETRFGAIFMSRYFCCCCLSSNFSKLSTDEWSAQQFTIHRVFRVPTTTWNNYMDAATGVSSLTIFFLCHFNSHIHIFRLFTGFYVSRTQRNLHNGRKSHKKREWNKQINDLPATKSHSNSYTMLK